MITSDQVVLEARRWIGTPYRHQSSTIGAGTDCLGLLRGIWRALVGPEPEDVPAYTPDWSEPSGREDMMAAAGRWLVPVKKENAACGDILIFRMRKSSVAKHIGIAASRDALPTFIHAYTGHTVVETPLSVPWASRVVARYKFPIGD